MNTKQPRDDNQPEQEPSHGMASDESQRKRERQLDRTGHGSPPAAGNSEEVVGGRPGPVPPENGAGGPPVNLNQAAEHPTLASDQDDHQPEGGDSSNTPPQKTKHPPALSLGGEDWLTVNFYVNHNNFTKLSKQLDRAKEAAQLGNLIDSMIEIGDFKVHMQESGAKQGGGSKAQRVRWVLKTEQGLTLKLLNREQAHETQPNVTVTSGSVLLMRYGIDSVWELMQHVVQSLDCEIIQNKISRVDANVDLPGIPVGIFTDAYRNDFFVTRAHNNTIHTEIQSAEHRNRKRDTGFTIGKSPLRLDVYDKTYESRNDPLKLSVLEAHRLGENCKVATRVEFQIRRAKLKQFGIDTVKDWFKQRGSVVRYLAEEWFRLTHEPIDPLHANRAETHAFWQLVQQRFAECYDSPSGEIIFDPLPTLTIETSKRVKTIIGGLKGVMARSGTIVEDLEQFIRETVFMIRDQLADRDIAAEIQQKRIELGINHLGIEVNDDN